MPISRRNFLKSSIVPVSAGAGALLVPAASTAAVSKRHGGLKADTGLDASRELQLMINQAAARGKPVLLPPGRILVGGIHLPDGLQLVGMPGRSVLEWNGVGSFIIVDKASDVRISGISFVGALRPFLDEKPAGGHALIRATDAVNLRIEHCRFIDSAAHSISLNGCSGALMQNEIRGVADTAIFAVNSTGLEVSHNVVRDCANNGIQIWRSAKGEDGSIVSHNRISHINNRNGGSGQWGNGINVFKAGNVIISHNRISDCAYSAVRVNAGDAAHISGNSCARLGEVAIFVEFGFLGAIISNNSVEDAEVGISITNLDVGGRLAVCQGNLVRDLSLKGKQSAEGGGGIGIFAEAETSITGNVIEGADRCGLQIGWGPYMRNVSASGNIISNCEAGIAVSVVKKTGQAVIANNIISGSKGAAIQGMEWQKPVTDDLVKAGVTPPKNLTLTGNVTS